MTTVVYVILLYVMVSVAGTSGQISTPALYATACYYLELHCDIPDHVIHVISVYLGEGPGKGSGCNLEEEDCFIYDEDFHEDVMNACHYQHACSGIHVPYVYDYCKDDSDDAHAFDYGVVEYRCIYNSTSYSNPFYATACRDDEVELTCDLGRVINVISVYLIEDRGSNSHCTLEKGDCFSEDAGFYEDVMHECNLRAACSVGVPNKRGYCEGDPRYYRFDYGVVLYQCLYNGIPKDNDFFFWTCSDKKLEFELCPGPNRSISDIHVTLHASCEPEYGDCFNVYNETSAGYTGPIFEKCTGKRACTDLVIQSEAMECSGDERSSTYTYMSYRCLEDETMREASRLHNDSFDDITCGPDATIHVINGFYGDTGSEGLGSNGDISIFDCRVNVDADYMETITDSCDGQRSCGDLRAQRSSSTYCNPGGWPNEYSEYVTIVYRCVAIPEPTTSPRSPTTQTDRLYTTDPPTQKSPKTSPNTEPATIPGGPTTQTDRLSTADSPTQRSRNTSSNTGLVVGVVVAVTLVIAAVIVVVVFILRKKRVRKDPSPQPTTAAYPNAIYGESPDNTSPVPSRGPGNGAALGPQAASTEPPEYSLATAVDEYDAVHKTKKHPKAAHEVQNGSREKPGPREPNKKIHGYIHGKDTMTARTKNSTPSDDQTADYVNYNPTSGRGSSSERQSQLELDSAELVLVDNANYGTGPLKHNTQGTPAGEYTTADNRGTRRSDEHDDTELFLVDNANYANSLWANSDDAYSGVNERDQTRGSTAYSRDTGRSDGDDTNIVIVDNASYGSILRGDSSDVYSAVHEGDQARNHGTGPTLGDTDFEIMDNPNYA